MSDSKAGLPSGTIPGSAAAPNSGALGRGDLLRLLKLGLAPEAAGELLGYRPPAHAPLGFGAGSVATVSLSSAAATASGKVLVGGAAETATASVAPPLWQVIGPDVTTTDSESPLPKCLRGGPACSEAELSNRTEAAPEVRPLLSKARLGVTLRGLLLRESETDEVDDLRLVEALARCSTLSCMPRRIHRTWPARIQVLWDESKPMWPIRHDQRQVLLWLRRWRGELGLEELVIRERRHPEWHRRISRGPLARVQVLPRKHPDAGTTLLALSDLGCLNQDPARREFWESEVQQAARAGAECRALVPCPPARWGRALARRWGARNWERVGRARTGTAHHQVATAASVLDDLFVLLSPAAWVDWPLLRAVRRLLGSAGASVATEVDAWLDSRIAVRSAPTGFVIEAKAQRTLRAAFAQLPEARRQRVAVLLRTLHAHLGLVPRMDELWSLGDDTSRRQALDLLGAYTRLLRDRGGIPEPVESAYAGGLEQRQQPGAWTAVEELRTVWALHHADGDHFDTPLPEGMRAQDIQWALANLPPVSECRLWQRGSELCLELSSPTRGSREGQRGSPPCDLLPLRTRRVEVRWQDRSLQQRSLGLDLESGASRGFVPPLGIGGVQRISLSSDLASAEVVLAPHPTWADRFWRDGSGLWVSTKVPAFEWRQEYVPAAKRSWLGRKAAPGGQARITIVRTELDTRLLWPAWASRLEKDEHGLFAELVLAEKVVTKLRWIPPGRFFMGSPKDEAGRLDDEGPQHWVRLQGYWLADAPCTQAEWEAVMGTTPSHFKGPKRPVENVSWEDCQQYCEKLRARFPGLSARLPTEAEWEYACRAGTGSAFNDGSPCTEPAGDDPALASLGWFEKNSGGETHPVRKLAPNQLGLFDMHGNVWEWCEDRFGAYVAEEQVDPDGAAGGPGRVRRGGSWGLQALYCRSACRDRWHPSERYHNLGFRLASGQLSQVEQAGEERAAGKPGGPEARGARQRASGRKRKEG